MNLEVGGNCHHLQNIYSNGMISGLQMVVEGLEKHHHVVLMIADVDLTSPDVTSKGEFKGETFKIGIAALP